MNWVDKMWLEKTPAAWYICDLSDFGVIRYQHTIFSPYRPMKPNVHEYPEHATERELLQYKIAVEQAALDGQPIEISKAHRNQWSEYGVHDVPAFCWGEWHYRVARPKIAEGHNPGGVTEDQIPEGWRLFSLEEFKHLESSRDPGNIYDTRFWDGQGWSETGCWSIIASDGTLITQKPAGFYLPKPKPVQPSTILGWLNTLPDGYRERALKNHHACRDEWPAMSASGALIIAFPWAYSPEGLAFWSQVADALRNPLYPFPPLPDAPKKVVPWSLDNFVWPDCVRRRAGGKVYGVQLADEYGLYIGFHDASCEGKTHDPIDWQELAEGFEYSIDNGTTWQPCCRTEDAS